MSKARAAVKFMQIQAIIGSKHFFLMYHQGEDQEEEHTLLVISILLLFC
jgi:hypothetical protein